MTTPIDFNGAEIQDTALAVIPGGTLARVRLSIRPGGTGPEGWLTQSRTSEALYLNTEAVILEGPYARRRVYTRIGIKGRAVNERGEDVYASRGRALIRGILESARGVRTDDSSDQARAARTIRGFGDLNGLEPLVRIGIDRDRANPATRAATSSPPRSGPTTPSTPGTWAPPRRRPRPLPRRPRPGRLRRRPPVPPAARQPRRSGRAEAGMIPRDYQRAAVDAARARTAMHGNTMLVLPTGAGKTATAGLYIGAEAAAAPDARFLVLQHTDELIEQNRTAIGAITGLPVSVVKAGQDDWSGRVVFGSVQTLARANRRARMAAVSHLVIDECHRAAADSYQAVIGHARALRSDLKLLGLSATPERGDGRSLRRTFSNVAYQVEIGTLIEQGILVPPRTFTIDLGLGDALGGIEATAGDYDMTAAARVLNHAVLNEAVVEHWQARAGDRRTIAFCATVEHAEAVAAAFRAAGVTAATITGTMPATARAELIARFDRGEVQLLANCMVLTEGFDSQPVGCIAILRPMLHKGTFIQAIGRGLRKVDPERFPGIVKTDCIVLDFAGAALRHGSLEQAIGLEDEERAVGAGDQQDLPRVRGAGAAGHRQLSLLRPCLAAAVAGPAAARAVRAHRDRPARPLAVPLVRPARRRPRPGRQRLRCLGGGVLRRRRPLARGRPAEERAAAPPGRRRAVAGAGGGRRLPAPGRDHGRRRQEPASG